MTEQPAEPTEDAPFPSPEVLKELHDQAFTLAVSLVAARDEKTLIEMVVQDACSKRAPFHNNAELVDMIRLYGIALSILSRYLAIAVNLADRVDPGKFDAALRAAVSQKLTEGE